MSAKDQRANHDARRSRASRRVRRDLVLAAGLLCVLVGVQLIRSMLG